MSLSIFFPCFNEEANLTDMVEKAAQAAPLLTEDYEIIVVDDGSTDRTQGIARELVLRYPFVKTVRHPENRGYGAALISGFRAASKEWVFFTDGDRQFDLAELAKLWEKKDQVDAVIGYRLSRQDHFLRILNALLWRTWIRLFFGLKVRDLNCAFKLFRRSRLQLLSLESQGAFISVELLHGLRCLGVRFEEVGVHHYPRVAGRPTGANPLVIAKSFWEMFLFWVRRRKSS